MATSAGTRLRCEVCAAEAIVLTAVDPELTCCGRTLSPMARPGEPNSPTSTPRPD
jgi:hypothetical protein